mgnify:CR=1 FL=1
METGPSFLAIVLNRMIPFAGGCYLVMVLGEEKDENGKKKHPWATTGGNILMYGSVALLCLELLTFFAGP